VELLRIRFFGVLPSHPPQFLRALVTDLRPRFVVDPVALCPQGPVLLCPIDLLLALPSPPVFWASACEDLGPSLFWPLFPLRVIFIVCDLLPLGIISVASGGGLVWLLCVCLVPAFFLLPFFYPLSLFAPHSLSPFPKYACFLGIITQLTRFPSHWPSPSPSVFPSTLGPPPQFPDAPFRTLHSCMMWAPTVLHPRASRGRKGVTGGFFHFPGVPLRLAPLSF